MPELRKDPVLKRWVIVARDRVEPPAEPGLRHEVLRSPADCPFCVGSEADTLEEVLRYPLAEDASDESKWALRVMPNKFPALKLEGRLLKSAVGMYDRMTGLGAHEVLVESPRHEARFANFTNAETELVVRAYRERLAALSADPRFKYVLVFKNAGRAAGASQEHSHSQIIATPVVPKAILEELSGAENYYRYKERCVYCDLVHQELSGGARLFGETEHMVAFAPFASRFPYEITLIPKTHQSDFLHAAPGELRDFAHLLRDSCAALGRTLSDPPYNFVLHTGPTHQPPLDHFHWHLEIVPRLVRVAGFEWGSGFYINPVGPEEAAKRLRKNAAGGSA